jgi:hypothetical protein
MSQYLNSELGDKMMELTSQYLISIIDKGLYKNNNFLQDDIEKTLTWNFYPYSSEEQIIEFQNVLKYYTFNVSEINELINEFYYNAVVDIHGEYEGALEGFVVECLNVKKLMEVSKATDNTFLLLQAKANALSANEKATPPCTIPNPLIISSRTNIFILLYPSLISSTSMPNH